MSPVDQSSRPVQWMEISQEYFNLQNSLKNIVFLLLIVVGN